MAGRCAVPAPESATIRPETRKVEVKLNLRLVVSLSSLCANPVVPQSNDVPRPLQIQGVNEAAFRYIFARELAGSKASAFCISSTSALPADFIKRFANNKPPVAWFYECPFSKSAEQFVQHVSVQRIRWNSSSDVEMEVHYRDGELGAGASELHLNRNNGHWSVTFIRALFYS
jgi:hypothetical protein